MFSLKKRKLGEGGTVFFSIWSGLQLGCKASVCSNLGTKQVEIHWTRGPPVNEGGHLLLYFCDYQDTVYLLRY